MLANGADRICLLYAVCEASEQREKDLSRFGPNTPRKIGSIAWRKRQWAAWRATPIFLDASSRRSRHTQCIQDAIDLIGLNSSLLSLKVEVKGRGRARVGNHIQPSFFVEAA